MQAVHGWLSTYERLVNSQNFFSPYLTQEDMSRLGRDYLKVGQVMEVLRQRGVRLIAINDGVDSLKGDDDFTPFRNIMNLANVFVKSFFIDFPIFFWKKGALN